MGNNEATLAAHTVEDLPQQKLLSFVVHRAQNIVQNYQLTGSVHTAGQAQALLLSPGQQYALLANQRLIAQWEFLYLRQHVTLIKCLINSQDVLGLFRTKPDVIGHQR